MSVAKRRSNITDSSFNCLSRLHTVIEFVRKDTWSSHVPRGNGRSVFGTMEWHKPHSRQSGTVPLSNISVADGCPTSDSPPSTRGMTRLRRYSQPPAPAPEPTIFDARWRNFRWFAAAPDVHSRSTTILSTNRIHVTRERVFFGKSGLPRRPEQPQQPPSTSTARPILA